MIPVLVDWGYRAIAMDHLGMGRSDKPTAVASYNFMVHYNRLEQFVEALGLTDINLFAQDWGSLIGLRFAGLNPGLFSRIAIGDGSLPVLPEGAEVYPPVENPDETVDIPSPFAQMPAQQIPFYNDECELLMDQDPEYFGQWMIYSMKAEGFHAAEVVEALTWFDLPEDEEAAYDAPFPSRIYMAGPRTFPSCINDLPGINDEAWAGLTSFEKPFLTIWAGNDPGNLGRCETQQQLIDSVPGAADLLHDRLPEASHFLQDDQGEEIARRLAHFYLDVPFGPDHRYCEIVLVSDNEGALEAVVWGTQGLNRCPAASWEALDEDTIISETGAVEVKMNGPRYWLVSATTGSLPDFDLTTFGDLEMHRLATIDVDSTETDAPYVESTVIRTTTYTFFKGEKIFELTSPEGAVYVMQSMSQIVDPELKFSDLPTLDTRLELPEGWSYTTRKLDAELVMTADGEAVIIQDDLENTYQKR
jgi:pimeloyl-ACP methyl ester carboxylesterase